jgi:hypothetical protein
MENEKDFLAALEAAKAEQPTEMPIEQEAEVEQTQEVVQEEQPEEVQPEEAQAEERTQEGEEVVTQEEEEDVLVFDDEPEQVTTAAPQPTAEVFESLKQFGIEVTSKEQLAETIKQLKTKADQVDTIWASEEIKVANEIMKQGGNWQDYLQVATTDWDAINDEQLLMYDLELALGKDEAQSALEEMPEWQKKREAAKIRNEQKSIQAEQKAQMQDKARKAKESFINGIESALSELQVVSKVKVNDADKANLKKLMTTYDEKLRANEMQKKYFLNEKGEPDFKKMMQSVAKLEMFDKVVEVTLKQAKNQGKREVIEKVSNVNNPRQNQTVQDVSVRKPLTPYEKAIASLQEGKDPFK